MTVLLIVCRCWCWALCGCAALLRVHLRWPGLLNSACCNLLQACENFRCLCTGEKGTGKASGKWLPPLLQCSRRASQDAGCGALGSSL